MDATHRAGSDILPYIIKDGPNSGCGGAPSQTAPRPRLRDLPNRISIDEKDPRRWLGRLARDDSRPPRARGNSHPSILFDQVGAMSIQRDGAFDPLLDGVIYIPAMIFSAANHDTVGT